MAGGRLAEPSRPREASARFAVREVVLLFVLYMGYSVARTFASDSLHEAMARAFELRDLQLALRLPGEEGLNHLAAAYDWIGVPASFWYATAHYLVTAGALVWLFRVGVHIYAPARRALVLATCVALVFYLAWPMAPPRFVSGFIDVLALHQDVGWWGAEASAPRAFGGMTNQLAAFPSMHAGWALWVTLAVWSATARWAARLLAVVYAAITAVVVIATGNHWALDVLGGFVVVGASWWLVGPGHWSRQPGQQQSTHPRHPRE